MKCLYAGGDSWCEGDELGLPYDPVHTPQYRYYHSWPRRLADRINYPVCVNDGLRGTSGARIYRRAMRFIRQWLKNNRAEDLCIAVGWTTLERDEVPVDADYKGVKVPYYIPYHWHCYNLPTMSSRMKIDSSVLSSLESIHKQYTLTQGTVSREAVQLERMANLDLTCRSLGVKLLQTWALDPDRKFCSHLEQLPIAFVEYVRLHGLGTLPGGHATKEGHQQWAQTLADYYETLYPRY